MSVSALLKAVEFQEDADSAKAIAMLFNGDRAMVRLIEGRSHFTGDDVLRLGNVLSQYFKNDAGAQGDRNTSV